MVQMGAFGNRRPAQLSGGQQQRIALARALVFEPELVLMDEPLGALDKQLREHMQFEIKHLHEQLGITVVYVTHDQGEALTMSDRIAVFNDGRIQQLAPPADLYERPDNSFVAQFIGENNKLDRHGRGHRRRPRAVRLPTGELIDATPVNVTRKGRADAGLDPPRAGGVQARDAARRRPYASRPRCWSSSTWATSSARGCASPGSDDFVIKCRNTLGQRMLRPGREDPDRLGAAGCRALDPL